MKFPSLFNSIGGVYGPLFWFIVIIFILIIIVSYSNYNVKRITVKSKFISPHGRYSNNMVGDTDGNTYTVSNYIFAGNFKSAEIYNSMDIGTSYTVSTYGIRAPFLGMFPNIVKATPA